MMKKLLITNIDDPNDINTWSGTTLNLIKGFRKNGIIIKGIKTGLNNKIKTYYVKVSNFLTGYGIYDYGRSLASRRFAIQRLEKFIKDNQINNILHTSTFDIPILTTYNDINHYLYCDSTWNLRLKFAHDKKKYTKKMLRESERFERLVYHKLKHIFSISEFVKKNLIDYYGINPNNITVVGTGRNNIIPFEGEKDYNNGKILFVANKRFEEKGGFNLLKAFKLAVEKNFNLELILVGDKKYFEFAKKIKNVKVKSFIELGELQRLYNEATLFVMPAEYEPWGIVYLEALSCKIPIIGLNRNSLPEITNNGKYGFLLENSNTELLADAILNAYYNPSLLKEMGEKGQKYCLEKYSWNITACKIIKKMF